MIRQIYMYDHYTYMRDSLKQSNITLPPEAKIILDKFDVVKVKLKDIKLSENRTLGETSMETYTQENEIHGACQRDKWFHGAVRIYDTEIAKKSFHDLTNSIQETGYDPSKCVIVLDKNNLLIDGEHRCCLLSEKYGNDYEVMVVRARN